MNKISRENDPRSPHLPPLNPHCKNTLPSPLIKKKRDLGEKLIVSVTLSNQSGVTN